MKIRKLVNIFINKYIIKEIAIKNKKKKIFILILKKQMHILK